VYTRRGEVHIPAFDIELGQNYNEKVRPNYKPKEVGKMSLPFFKNASGFFISEELRLKETNKEEMFPVITFYEFLVNFHVNIAESARIFNKEKGKK